MTNNRNDSPDHLTFSQRYGLAPLPEPMRLGEISKDLRRELWNVTYAFLDRGSHSDWTATEAYFETHVREFIKRAWGRFTKVPESRVRTEYGKVIRDFESQY